MGDVTWRTAVIAFAPFFALVVGDLMAGGDVIASHRQHAELGTGNVGGAGPLENRKFSDFTGGFVPEISEHLRSPRSGWLTLWIIHNELGRPAFEERT